MNFKLNAFALVVIAALLLVQVPPAFSGTRSAALSPLYPQVGRRFSLSRQLGPPTSIPRRQVNAKVARSSWWWFLLARDVRPSAYDYATG